MSDASIIDAHNISLSDWSDVDPNLLAKILEECFGGTADEADNIAADEQRMAAAFENTFESLVRPFLSSNEPSATASAHDSQADHIASLHNGLTDCNARLLQMEDALKEFHSRILDVCTEIEVLRSEAVGTRAARDGKRALQKHIGALLDLVVIPPDVVHLVLMTPEYQQRGGIATGPTAVVDGSIPVELSQQFLLSVRRLHGLIRRRMANQDIVLGRTSTAPLGEKSRGNVSVGGSGSSVTQQHELILKLFRCKAFREMVATTEDLLIFVCMRIRAFLEAKITALENPRTNSVAQQENVLRSHRQLVRFMQDSCAYLKMTVAIRPTTSSAAGGQYISDEPNASPGTPHHLPSLSQQHKPFIPYRIVKALYDDLKVQYLTILSRVYTGRLGRYLTALSEMQLGHQGGDANAAAQQSVASSVVGGLTSLFWGASSAGASDASSGPSQQEHLAVVRAITKPPLIGDRCSIGPFAVGGSASPSGAPSSAHAAMAAGTIMMDHGVPEDLGPFSLGNRSNIFKSDTGVVLPSASRSSAIVGELDIANNSSTYSRLAKATTAAENTHLSLGDVALDPHEDAGVFKAPTIPHISRMRRQYHSYEETFRSINHILADIVTHEYLFLLDFFGADSWQMCVDIFRKTYQNVVDHISDKILLNAPRADLLQQQLNPNSGAASQATNSLGSTFSPFVSGNKDLGGLLILFRTTLIFRVQMLQVRQLHILEPFYHSVLTILWPAIHAALEDHNRSLRVCGSLASDRINAVNGHPSGSRPSPTPASLPPIPTAKSIATVHPIAARYAELGAMVLALIDLSFVKHYSKLRVAESRTVLAATAPSSTVTSPNLPTILNTTFNASGAVSPPSVTGISPVVEVSSALAVPSVVASEEDEDELALRNWISVLRGNLSVMRIEVCRLLSLHCKVYADACNAMLRGRLADEYGNTKGTGVISPVNSSSAQSEERLWMAACAPQVNSLHHIISVWEHRLLSPKQAEALRNANGDVNAIPRSVALGYDLGASLPTGLKAEWIRYHSNSDSSATVTPVANPRTLSVFGQQRVFPSSTPSPPPQNDVMTFNLFSNPDYIALKSLLAKVQKQFTKIVVSVSCPCLSHLPSLQTTFDDDTLAEDLLLLSVQYDPDDVLAIEAAGSEEGGDNSARSLRFGSAERQVEDSPSSAPAHATAHESYVLDDTPISTRAARLIRYCKIVLGRCSSFVQSWQSDVRSLRRIVYEYVIHPDTQRAVLVVACSLLLAANTHLHEQLTGAVDILSKLHALKERDESLDHLELPPAVTSMGGLVVTNHQLVEHLRSFVVIESSHDAHPDL